MEESNPMRNLVRNVALAGGLVMAGGLATAEDLTIVSRTSVGDKPSTTTSYFTAGKFRTGDGTVDTIADIGSGQMSFVDHKKKEYWQTSQAEIQATFAQLDEQMKAMGGAGGLMEKMMGGPMPEVVVTKGTNARTIAGYPTEHWIVTAGDWKYELWAASGLELPSSYWQAAKAPFATMGPLGRRFSKMFDAMGQVKGFPLASNFTYKMMGKTVASSTEATEVKKGAIAATAFDVPAGYKKKDSPFKDMQKKAS
jgi:hypothetical protein